MGAGASDVLRRLRRFYGRQATYKANDKLLVIKELDNAIHPNNVRKIKYDGKPLEHSVLRGINVFIMAYFLLIAVSILLISVDDFDLETNFTAVAATLNNIGPGLEKVGPTLNYSGYSAFSTCVLIFDMIAGRLEILPVLVLLIPGKTVICLPDRARPEEKREYRMRNC